MLSLYALCSVQNACAQPSLPLASGPGTLAAQPWGHSAAAPHRSSSSSAALAPTHPALPPTPSPLPASLPSCPQWAPIEYHRTSLLNLQEAMRRTKRLCAVMLDCLGRELMIKRKYGVDETGWPGIFEQLNIKRGQRVRRGHGSCSPVQPRLAFHQACSCSSAPVSVRCMQSEKF